MIDRSILIENRKQILCRQSKNKAIAAKSLPFFQDAECTGHYYPVRGEADIFTYREEIDERTCALPVVLNDTEMKFYFPREMRTGAFSIPEPVSDPAQETIPDVIVVPMLAFCWAYRIGYGKGYYDRYLAAHPESLRLGIAYDEQEIQARPAPWDEPLDVLVTPERLSVFVPLRPELSDENRRRISAAQTFLKQSGVPVSSDRRADAFDENEPDRKERAA
ncbi:MAG: 5-formyltetrahydrofolate cyclo-ligase [Allobaculum sp.]|uniref:5-formyltetrahydrofolate cyclo-ligase n=1 Tax=Allobaculum sp. TaxID=1872463 RepID=UPI00399A7112